PLSPLLDVDLVRRNETDRMGLAVGGFRPGHGDVRVRLRFDLISDAWRHHDDIRRPSGPRVGPLTELEKLLAASCHGAAASTHHDARLILARLAGNRLARLQAVRSKGKVLPPRVLGRHLDGRQSPALVRLLSQQRAHPWIAPSRVFSAAGPGTL